MIPATAGSFFLLGCVLQQHPALLARIWPLTPAAYALLGLVAGLGFMLGELPNSFLKRQMGIPPGTAPASPHLRAIFLGFDRMDSIVGALLAVSLMVPTPWEVWLYVALLGPGPHWLFSAVLYWSGVKGRPS